MKSRYSRVTKFGFGLLMFALLLASCAPSLPAGQVTGRLIANGEPLSMALVYIAIAPEEGAGSTWTLMHDTNTDEEGNFLYENMAPGKYLLMVGETGLYGTSFNYVMRNGERYTFELPDGKGVDLGEVDASVTQGNP